MSVIGIFSKRDMLKKINLTDNERNQLLIGLLNNNVYRDLKYHIKTANKLSSADSTFTSLEVRNFLFWVTNTELRNKIQSNLCEVCNGMQEIIANIYQDKSVICPRCNGCGWQKENDY